MRVDWGLIPSRNNLSADGAMSLAEHRQYVRACQVGQNFARYLHGKPDRRKAEAALKEIIGMGHDVENDGSIFDCGVCWQTAKSYKRTGRI